MAQEEYEGLLSVCDGLGLQVALDKCQAPAFTMLWIGVWFDAIRMIMAIDRKKIKEAVELCRQFMEKNNITLHQLQKLLGKLFHVSKCTVGARAFLARMLDLLRLAAWNQIVQVTPAARADASWFVAFLDNFNGITTMKQETAEFVAEVHSCLTGGGGVCKGQGYYAVKYPDYITSLDLSISSLECLNLLFAIRLWAEAWQGSNILIFCDNMATVCAATSARAEDPIIRGALREFWWLAATRDLQITVRHKPGSEMNTPDILSRAFHSKEGAAKYHKFTTETSEKLILLPDSLLMPPLPL